MSRSVTHISPGWGGGATAVVLLALVCLQPRAGAPQNAPPPVSFDRAPEEYGSVPTFEVGLGDLDADGDLDAVFANMGFNHSQVLLNDGRGVFVDSQQELTEQGHGVGIGDLDGDRDLDLFMTCAGYIVEGVVHNRPSRVYLNLGDGTFVDSGQDFLDIEPSGNLVQLVDVDCDGDLDAFVVYYLEPARVYLNDGAAWFVVSDQEFPAGSTWADLDSDDHADLFIKEEGVGYRVMLNDGQGVLSEAWSLADASVVFDYHNISFADLDSDGDLDAFDSNGTRDEERPLRVWLNDGGGRFTLGPQVPGSASTAWIVLADLNLDSHIDAFLSCPFRPDQVWLNDGQGGFVDSGLRLGGDAVTRGTALGDVDDDGDVDLFVASYGLEGGPNEVWINCTCNGRCFDRSQPCCDDAVFVRRVLGRYRTWP